MMRQVTLSRFGGPEVLEITERPPPTPTPGQVRIRVTRAGVALGDVMRRRGLLAPSPPFTPGYDVVGTTDDGRRVACLMPSIGLGGYAEVVCVPRQDAIPVPDAVDDDTAIALVLNYVTAWQIVHRVARLEPGQRLLVQGASGGVGTAMLDVGRAAGLELFGTASPHKHSVVRAYGATPIDYHTEDVAVRLEEAVDAVADPIGGANLRRSYATLRRGGTLIFFGITDELDSGPWAFLRAALHILSLRLRPDGRCVRPYGITVWPNTRARCHEDLAHLLDHADDFTPHIGALFPLDRVREAHAAMESGTVPGKILLRVS